MGLIDGIVADVKNGFVSEERIVLMRHYIKNNFQPDVEYRPEYVTNRSIGVPLLNTFVADALLRVLRYSGSYNLMEQIPEGQVILPGFESKILAHTTTVSNPEIVGSYTTLLFLKYNTEDELKEIKDFMSMFRFIEFEVRKNILLPFNIDLSNFVQNELRGNKYGLAVTTTFESSIEELELLVYKMGAVCYAETVHAKVPYRYFIVKNIEYNSLYYVWLRGVRDGETMRTECKIQTPNGHLCILIASILKYKYYKEKGL